MKTWKLITGAIITCAVLGLAPVLFQRLGWVRPLQQNAWLVVLITGFGLLVKLYIADRASDGEFLFYKFGYDNCIVSFGAVLTALSLQLQSDKDLFPSLSSVTVLSVFPRNMRLLLLLLAALLASLVTAHIAGDIKKNKLDDRSVWSFANSLIGTGMLGTYVLILVTKG
jgi:hypothetical protein